MPKGEPASLSVRPMARADIPAIAALEKKCFFSPWSEDTLLSELSNDTARFFCAFCDGDFAGYLGANLICGEVYIGNIAVLPAYRRRHAASALLEVLIARSVSENAVFITLEVRPSNAPAIALYRRFGFLPQGERPGFYSSPTENALIMTKFL